MDLGGTKEIIRVTDNMEKIQTVSPKCMFSVTTISCLVVDFQDNLVNRIKHIKTCNST